MTEKALKGTWIDLAALTRQKWHWFVRVVIGMRIVWLVGWMNNLYVQTASFTEKNGYDWDGTMIGLLTAGYLLSCAVPLSLFLYRKVPRVVPAAAELSISGLMYVYLSSSIDAGFDFFNVPILTLGFMSIGWHAAWTFAAGVLILPAAAAWTWGYSFAASGDQVFNLAVLFGIGFCFQLLVASYQKINGMYGTIQGQNQTLELYSKQIEKLTLAEERNRLSRDLHDTVGHTFTTTIMGMDAVMYLIDVSPEEAKKSLRELLHVTRSGLDEVRRHIHQIAPDKEDKPLAVSLAQIGSEFSLHTGTAVELVTEGMEHPVSEQVRLAYIRCLQESLTNAKKHGQAALVQVKLTFGGRFVELRVSDDGKGTSGLVRGFGLQAMADRMANLHGTLAVESGEESGTTVVCSVPVMSQGARPDREGA